MVNKKYNKGYRFELEVKKFLEQQGFLVFRSAGSHSPVDLVAFKLIQPDIGNNFPELTPYFIQCKATQETYVPKRELKRYLAFVKQWHTSLFIVFPRKPYPLFTVLTEHKGKPYLEIFMLPFVGKTIEQIREELEQEGKHYG